MPGEWGNRCPSVFLVTIGTTNIWTPVSQRKCIAWNGLLRSKGTGLYATVFMRAHGAALGRVKDLGRAGENPSAVRGFLLRPLSHPEGGDSVPEVGDWEGHGKVSSYS